VATDLKGHCRTVGVSDVDPEPVQDVDGRHPPAVDIEPVEAAVVDSNPSALVESH
jgi:hypothetical protein